MKKLIELLGKARLLSNEWSNLDNTEKEARDELDRIKGGDRFGPDEEAIVRTIEFKLLMVPTQRKNIEERVGRIRDELKTTFSAQVSRWNKEVRGHVEALQAEVAKALRPFYGDGNERRLQKDVALLNAPAVFEMRRAHFDAGFDPSGSFIALVDNVARFIRRVQTARRRFGWAE